MCVCVCVCVRARAVGVVWCLTSLGNLSARDPAGEEGSSAVAAPWAEVGGAGSPGCVPELPALALGLPRAAQEGSGHPGPAGRAGEGAKAEPGAVVAPGSSRRVRSSSSGEAPQPRR